jgi:hypothetical protein
MSSSGGEAGYRHVLAVLGEDSAIAHAAAELARLNRARLSVVQTWHAPVVLWSLAHPFLIPPGFSRDAETARLATEADARLRGIVRELDHPGPLEFRCCRGRTSSVALRAARSGAYDAVFVADCLALRCSRTARVFCRSGVLSICPEPGDRPRLERSAVPAFRL